MYFGTLVYLVHSVKHSHNKLHGALVVLQLPLDKGHLKVWFTLGMTVFILNIY